MEIARTNIELQHLEELEKYIRKNSENRRDAGELLEYLEIIDDQLPTPLTRERAWAKRVNLYWDFYRVWVFSDSDSYDEATSLDSVEKEQLIEDYLDQAL